MNQELFGKWFSASKPSKEVGRELWNLLNGYPGADAVLTAMTRGKPMTARQARDILAAQKLDVSKLDAVLGVATPAPKVEVSVPVVKRVLPPADSVEEEEPEAEYKPKVFPPQKKDQKVKSPSGPSLLSGLSSFLKKKPASQPDDVDDGQEGDEGKSKKPLIAKGWLIVGGAGLLVILGLVVFALVYFNQRPSAYNPGVSISIPTKDTNGMQLPQLLPTSMPNVDPTQVPTLVPAAESPSACDADKFLVSYRFPTQEVLNKRPFAEPNFTDGGQRVGTEISMRQYRVTNTPGLPGVLMVEQESGVYFVPESYFPAVSGEKRECLTANEAGMFKSTIDRISAGPLRAAIQPGDVWFPVLIAALLLMLAGVILAVFVGGRLMELIIIGLILFVALSLSAFVAPQGFMLLYASGLISCIALGSRGELSQLKTSVKRTGNPGMVSNEVRTSLDSTSRGLGIIGAIDWSAPGWWAGANLALGLLKPALSPLFVILGTNMAVIVLFVQICLFMGLEAYRRGGKGDWGAYFAGLLGLLYIPVFLFVADVMWMYVMALVGALVIAVILVVIGFSDREEVNRDRLPDSLFQLGACVLVALAFVVLII